MPSNLDTVWVLARRNPGDIYGYDDFGNRNDAGSAGDPGEAFLAPAAGVGSLLEAVAPEVVANPLGLFAVGGLAGLAAGFTLYDYLNPPPKVGVIEVPLDPSEPDVLVQTSRPPPPPTYTPVTAEDFLDPPNWQQMYGFVPNDVKYPYVIMDILNSIYRFAHPFDDSPPQFDIQPAPIPPLLIPSILVPQISDPVFAPLVSPTPVKIPETAQPFPYEIPAFQPIARPGTIEIFEPATFPQLPSLVSLPEPISLPSPTAVPLPGTFGLPFADPFAMPGTLFDPVSLPRSPLPLPFAGPLTGFNPVGLPSTQDQPDIPRDAGRCPPCTTLRPKSPKKKASDRTTCFEGKFREYSRGVFKFEKKIVPCEPKPKAVRAKKPPAKKYPPGNPFPGLPQIPSPQSLRGFL